MKVNIPNITDFRGDGDPGWCAGCGHYGALAAFERALGAVAETTEKTVFIFGPGCAGRSSAGLAGYRLEMPPGLAFPAAVGLASARDDLRIIVITGDADMARASAGHVLNYGRRNPRIAWVVFHNHGAAISASIGGDSADHASAEELFIIGGATWIGRADADNLDQCASTTREALSHAGFAGLIVKSVCATFGAVGARPRSPGTLVEATGDRHEALGRLRELGDSWFGTLLRAAGAPSTKKNKR